MSIFSSSPILAKPLILPDLLIELSGIDVSFSGRCTFR